MSYYQIKTQSSTTMYNFGTGFATKIIETAGLYQAMPCTELEEDVEKIADEIGEEDFETMADHISDFARLGTHPPQIPGTGG